MNPTRPAPAPPRTGPGLANVRHLLAVSSCKGGVGKSTVAVNLACSLSNLGMRVGIFDADIYGPSLPTLIDAGRPELFQRAGLIVPMVYQDMKLMSFGYLDPDQSGSAAILRGPRVSQVLNQLLTGTDWGELDVLVIDYPPGTGDIQLTLSQIVPISGAVIVTTPQQLSFVDVVKGISMFDQLSVPTLAVVENMSYFRCPKCGEATRIFGEGARRKLVEQYGYSESLEIPVVAEISVQGDAGRPYVWAHPETEVSKSYLKLAEVVRRDLHKMAAGGLPIPRLSYNVGQAMLLTLPDGTEHEFTPASLRRACRCAHCVDENTGQPKLNPAEVSEDVYPVQVNAAGNYAASVQWSDGHTTSIYPFSTLLAGIRDGRLEKPAS